MVGTHKNDLDVSKIVVAKVYAYGDTWWAILDDFRLLTYTGNVCVSEEQFPDFVSAHNAMLMRSGL